MTEKFRLKGLVLAVSACLMAGCGGGGGGGSGSSSSDSPAEPAETPASVNVSLPVQVIDGYLPGIDVCIVKEKDPSFACDDTFGTAQTDESGKAVFTIAEDRLRQLTYVKFKAVALKTTRNITRGESADLGTDLTLLGTKFISDATVESLKNDSQDGSEFRLTPFTTLVEKHLRTASTQPDESAYTEAFNKVAELIGVDPEVLASDYNSADGSEDADRALVAGELIVALNLLPNSTDGYKVNPADEQKSENLQDQLSAVKDNVDKVMEDVAKGDGTGSLASAISSRKDKLRNTFVSVSSGLAEAWKCGTTASNEVWCWGNNTWKNLGNPEFSAEVEKAGKYSPEGAEKRFENLVGNWTADPVHVLIKNPDRKSDSDPEYIPLTGVTKLSSGNIFACAVTVDRQVWCWGGNYQGQLGYGRENYSKENEAIPYAVRVVAGQQDSGTGYLENVVDISAAHNNVCALTGDGDVYCWGDNTALELGGSFEELRVHPVEQYTSYDGLDLNQYLWVVPEPVKVPAPEGTKFVSMTKGGFWAHCALTDPEENEYNLWCWGDDIRGLVSGGDTDTAGQYAAEIEKNWSDKHHHADSPYSKWVSWDWHYYDKGSGDWWPMFGQPVTNVTEYKVSDRIREQIDNGYSLHWNPEQHSVPVKRLTSADITEWDAVLVYSSAEEGSPALQAVYTDNLMSAVPYDWSINQYKASPWTDPANAWTMFDKLPEDGDTVAKIVTASETQRDYVVTEKGRLYEFGKPGYGMLGDGGEIESDRDAWQYEAPAFKDGRYQVKDVAPGKTSVCALATDSEAEDTDQPQLLCWGSSLFGQLGFDNGQDSDISWSDVAAAWSDGNAILDDEKRIQNTPKAVDFGL